MPAPIDNTTQELIAQTGRFISDLAGAKHCACHNEVMFMKHSNEVFGIEPNLRPAGMLIWDLASLSFNNFDPWLEWLKWAVGSFSL